MIRYIFFIASLVLILTSCGDKQESDLDEKNENYSLIDTYSDISIVDAMRNVMWKGELGPKIALDTIQNKAGLYGLGPLSYLKGEILIIDGITYVSKVNTDNSMTVERIDNASAPFFVYGNVTEWSEYRLPDSIKNIAKLESYIDSMTKDSKRPFAFKLSGEVEYADIHIQNLPDGTVVSSPTEAHQGQVNYEIRNEAVDMVGFFSTEHQAVFTHHDSFVHIHLITQDRKKMGHLDSVNISSAILYLPKS